MSEFSEAIGVLEHAPQVLAVLFLEYAAASFNVLVLILSMIYIMTGFIGFCVGWIPGLLIGCVFFSIIRRRPAELEGHQALRE